MQRAGAEKPAHLQSLMNDDGQCPYGIYYMKRTIDRLFRNLSTNMFLFEELVKRDFEKKYKRTALGMAWSVLSPMLTLLVMKIVFTRFFGKDTPHYTTYLFAGNIIMSYYREATNNGMSSLMNNASVITKINIPKYLFVLSQNVSALINFLLTVVVFFVFALLDGITLHPRMLMLFYPTLCLIIFNIGVGMILSALFVFFRDIRYLYSVFLMLLQYLSAIFYTVDRFPASAQKLFLLNPIYVYIKYFRTIVISQQIPSPAYHALCAMYAVVLLIIGGVIYKKYNHQFVYYI